MWCGQIFFTGDERYSYKTIQMKHIAVTNSDGCRLSTRRDKLEKKAFVRSVVIILMTVHFLCQYSLKIIKSHRVNK